MKPGDEFGKYRITSLLARGGMADLWLALYRSVDGFEKSVVLKMISPERGEHANFAQMFVNEATIAAKLNHPNIVQVFDFGLVDGRYYLTMEHIAGCSLRQIGRRCEKAGEPVPPWFTLRVLIDACEALQYAHDFLDEKGSPVGVVHRDVTPENIMVSFMNTVKILDFGIAKTTAVPGTLTDGGILKGKYAYVSPEQVREDPVDRRCDIYSLGVVTYELLTGRLPFIADNPYALLHRIEQGNPRSPRELAPWMSPALESVVLRALNVDPRQRFQQACHLEDALLAELRRMDDTHTPRELGQFVRGLFPDGPPVLDNSLVPGVTPKSWSYSVSGHIPDDNGELPAEQRARTLLGPYGQEIGEPVAAATDEAEAAGSKSRSWQWLKQLVGRTRGKDDSPADLPVATLKPAAPPRSIAASAPTVSRVRASRTSSVPEGTTPAATDGRSSPSRRSRHADNDSGGFVASGLQTFSTEPESTEGAFDRFLDDTDPFVDGVLDQLRAATVQPANRDEEPTPVRSITAQASDEMSAAGFRTGVGRPEPPVARRRKPTEAYPPGGPDLPLDARRELREARTPPTEEIGIRDRPTPSMPLHALKPLVEQTSVSQVLRRARQAGLGDDLPAPGEDDNSGAERPAQRHRPRAESAAAKENRAKILESALSGAAPAPTTAESSLQTMPTVEQAGSSASDADATAPMPGDVAVLDNPPEPEEIWPEERMSPAPEEAPAAEMASLAELIGNRDGELPAASDSPVSTTDPPTQDPASQTTSSAESESSAPAAATATPAQEATAMPLAVPAAAAKPSAAPDIFMLARGASATSTVTSGDSWSSSTRRAEERDVASLWDTAAKSRVMRIQDLTIEPRLDASVASFAPQPAPRTDPFQPLPDSAQRSVATQDNSSRDQTAPRTIDDGKDPMSAVMPDSRQTTSIFDIHSIGREAPAPSKENDVFTIATRRSAKPEGPAHPFATKEQSPTIAIAARVKGPTPTPAPPRDGNEAEELFEHGILSYRDGSYKDALKYWSRALEQDPANKRYQSNIRRLKQLVDDTMK